MKLASLDPRMGELGGRTQAFDFLCPRCLRRRIAITIWNGPAGDIEIDGVTRRL